MRMTVTAALLAAALSGCSEDLVAQLDDAAPPDAAPPDACVGEAPHIIFLNRGGGDYTFRANPDSRTNESNLVRPAGAEVPPANIDEGDWAALLTCVRGKFDRYNVSVVDVDPGDVDHLEIVEVPNDSWVPLGFEPNPDVSSLPPFACSGVPRGIAFAKADVGTAEDNCINASFDAGAMFGLQIVINDREIMSYSQATTLRTFTDVVAPCGFFEPDVCQCGGAEQNTHQRLLERVGPPVCR